ncbi:M48 family metallopeptidase [Spirosoma fluviale]|uniref:Peptidase family M48 n=1 Tax=Spirosoma fluviale TaxID=1597977 RepID=A0A286GW52_9BACT|nr:M48 family metallopeptidase [Spirosoma fluviale]SOD99722.1 Peptidase family M48 [Spirosoma fluviale]
MRNLILSSLLGTLLTLLPHLSFAQSEVAQSVKLENATIVEFKAPFREMYVSFEEDDDNRHSVITIQDTTLFMKKSAFNKRKKSTIKPDEFMQAIDFRAGMKINLQVDYFQITQRNLAIRICLQEKYYGPTTITGLYERLEGDKATIDGQMVVLTLDKGKSIEGREEWKNKKFTSFNDMQLGSEVQVWGERKPDGIIYATKGTNRPSMMSKEDYLLRKATNQELKVTKNELSIAEAWKFRFITSTSAQDYISTIGRQLVPDYIRSLPIDHPDHIDFKFYLVDDESFNASSYPNGSVVVHKGLLTKIDNEAQLAAILGHEIAHVTQKHHASQFRRHQNWEAISTFGALVAMGTGDITPALVTKAAGEMAVSSFSQQQEAQADRIGLHYMVKAGYDPREAALIWKKLAEEDKDDRQKGQRLAAMNWLQKSYSVNASSQQASLTNSIAQRNEQAAQLAQTAANTIETQPLFPSHPKPRQRFTNVNFLISTAYAQLDYATLKGNSDKFRNVVQLLGGSTSETIVPPRVTDKKITPKPKPKPKKA